MTWQAVVAGVALMALPIAACGSDNESGGGGGGGVTSGTSPALTTQQLSDALLTVDDLADLGQGWSETQRSVFTTREPENPSIDPSLWCPAGKGDELAALAGPAGADVELGIGTSYLVRQQAWTNADVASYLSSAKASVSACAGQTWKDEGGNAYTLQPAALVPAVGDDSVSWRVTIELTGATASTSFTDQTVARFGDVAMVLQAGATPTTGPDAVAPNYVALLRGAADKMDERSAP